MNSLRLCVLALAVATFSPGALAQKLPNGKDLFKGRIKPGLYENTVASEMIGYPGVTPEQGRSKETKKQCLTAEDISQGIELRSDCKVRTFKESGNDLHVVSDCPDGSVNEFKLVVSGGGYTSELKSAGKGPDGKPMSMSMRSEAKYLGASCRP